MPLSVAAFGSRYIAAPAAVNRPLEPVSMSAQSPSLPPWHLIAKKHAGQASAAELAAIEQWMVAHALPAAEDTEQIDITFEDDEAMAAWLRMRQRAKRQAATRAHRLGEGEGQALLPVPVAEIAHFTSHHGHVTLTTLGGQHYAVSFSLEELAAQAESHQFFWANPLVLLARPSVQELEACADGGLRVHLRPATLQKAIVPPARAGEFRAWLSGS